MITWIKHAMDGYKRLTIKNVRMVFTILAVILSCSIFANVSEAYGAADYNSAWMNSFRSALNDKNQYFLGSNSYASFYINTNYVHMERKKAEDKVDVWLFTLKNQPDSNNQQLIGERVRTIFKRNKRQVKVLSYVTLDPSGNVVDYAFNMPFPSSDNVAPGTVNEVLCNYIENRWLR